MSEKKDYSKMNNSELAYRGWGRGSYVDLPRREQLDADAARSEQRRRRLVIQERQKANWYRRKVIREEESNLTTASINKMYGKFNDRMDEFEKKYPDAEKRERNEMFPMRYDIDQDDLQAALKADSGRSKFKGYDLESKEGAVPYDMDHFESLAGLVLEMEGHPFFDRKEGGETPWIYETQDGGARLPMSELLRETLHPQSDRDYRDMAERFRELNVDDRVYAGSENLSTGMSPGRGKYAGIIFDEVVNHWASRDEPARFNSTETAVGTHEHQHGLDAKGKRPSRYGGKETSELPSVMAETIANLRAVDQEHPSLVDDYRFGAPGHREATGRFMHDSGTRYMYGRDPYTDEKLTHQRSMSDLLTTDEGKQWLKRMGEKNSIKIKSEKKD